MDAWLRRRLAWAALVVAAVGAALLVLPPASLARVVVDDVSTTTAAGFAAFLAFRRSRTSRDAQAWLFLGLGLALVAAGEAFWLLSDLVLQQRVASLSLADSLYYGGYAALLVAVACWFPRLGGPSAWLRRLLDFAIVVTSLSMMAWVTVGAGLVERYPGETFGAVVAISYPLLDLALAATFIILALEVPSGTRGPMMVVGLGIGIWAAADLSYAFLAAEGAYASGLPLATAWVAGYLLVAAGAAWHPSPPPSQPAGARDRTAMAWLPYAFAAPALAVAITRYATFADLGAVEEMLLLLLVFAILLRQFLFIEDQTAVGRELRASEAGLADAQAISHVGSWEWDTVRNLATMSAEGLRVWGLPPDSGALPLQRFIDLVHPEDRAILEGATNEAVASGTGYDVTVRAQSPVGMRNTRHRGQVSRRDASGRPTILRGTIEDITDRVVAERALRRSEERFRMTARATQDVLWEWDAATNTSYHSEQIASYGLDPAAVATMEGFSALIHPDDLKGFGRAIDKLLTGSEDHLSAEYRFRRADGTYADILDKALILRDEAGHPVRLVGAMQDISERKRADRELMARQALLAETQAVGHVGSWEIDLLTGKQRSSDENQRLYGLGLDEEVTPESVGRNIYPEDAPRILELLGRIPRTGSEEIECRVVRPDGSLRWLYTKGVARYDDAGRPVRITGFTQDITERKRAEQELQARDSRFEEVQAIARVGSWEWVAATDRVTLTEQASRNWGLSPDQGPPLLKEFLALAHPDDRGFLEDAVAHASPGGRGNPSLSAEHDIRIPQPNGDMRWLRLLVKLKVDEQGRPERLVGLSQDITERKRADDALRTSEARLRTLLDNVDEYYVSTDLVAGTTLNSAGVERIFGGPKASYDADPDLWITQLHPDDSARVLASYSALLAGTAIVEDTRIVRPAGDVRWIRATMHPIKDDAGKVVRIDGIIRDITAEHEMGDRRREIERLKESAEFKAQFLNNAAHELSTPLTPIKLHMASLRRGLFGDLQPKQEEAVALVDRNFQRLAMLVTDLIDAARLQGGKLRLLRKPVRPAGIVEEVVESVQEKARLDGITLRIRGLASSLQVEGDEGRLHQVLLNLVYNALKFTPRGGFVEVGLAQEGPQLAIRVKDSGVGLTAEQIGRLFQPFMQVHDTKAMNRGGTGLGLYISRGIIEQHGGTLTCSSDGPGQGSTFEVRLALMAVDAPVRGASQAA